MGGAGGSAAPLRYELQLRRRGCALRRRGDARGLASFMFLVDETASPSAEKPVASLRTQSSTQWHAAIGGGIWCSFVSSMNAEPVGRPTGRTALCRGATPSGTLVPARIRHSATAAFSIQDVGQPRRGPMPAETILRLQPDLPNLHSGRLPLPGRTSSGIPRNSPQISSAAPSQVDGGAGHHPGKRRQAAAHITECSPRACRSLRARSDRESRSRAPGDELVHTPKLRPALQAGTLLPARTIVAGDQQKARFPINGVPSVAAGDHHRHRARGSNIASCGAPLPPLSGSSRYPVTASRPRLSDSSIAGIFR